MSVSQKVAEDLKLELYDDELKAFLDFSLYDLVINVDKLGIDAAAEMIVNVADTEHIRQCSLTTLESMEKL